ncbi:MAG: hypothetical protein NTY27_05185 [Actinobacteria bacterium]|nr:hypothetical protein [Actinomycetota bacterium]
MHVFVVPPFTASIWYPVIGAPLFVDGTIQAKLTEPLPKFVQDTYRGPADGALGTGVASAGIIVSAVVARNTKEATTFAIPNFGDNLIIGLAINTLNSFVRIKTIFLPYQQCKWSANRDFVRLSIK